MLRKKWKTVSVPYSQVCDLQRFNVLSPSAFCPQAPVLSAHRHVTCSANLPLVTHVHLTFSQNPPSLLGNSVFAQGGEQVARSLLLFLCSHSVPSAGSRLQSFWLSPSHTYRLFVQCRFWPEIASRLLGSMCYRLCFCMRCFFNIYSSYALSRSLAAVPLFFFLFVILNRERLFGAQALSLIALHSLLTLHYIFTVYEQLLQLNPRVIHWGCFF